MSLNELLSLNGVAFLQTAYQLILNRELDDSGQNYYGIKMLAGARKYDVISALANSKEARKNGSAVPGMKTYLARQRWADFPIIGWFVRQFHDVESRDPVSRQIRALQMQLASGSRSAGPAAVASTLGIVSAPTSHPGLVLHENASSALDAVLQDDLSAETIAIYALLKSPA
ncbi:DUF4214 domain-containing protein [Sphingobium sp.]|uniref:DUF4214 domain-containing protein n=1 Tax=Sphingobium sp. TaxID=1912891 RepID=UPI002C69FBEB|nr:DUF4214 domain-containing protein [Sphingobium sp.]HUD90495.1 DUF4214 domain-containing protein [Sphingobium sp.]